MAARGGAQPRTAAPQLLSIGQVLGKLTPEFTDLTPSKLRFLEAEGLVAPQRTESGYRKFCHEDVERLRFVLTMQRDHYLPLRVIREQLDDFDAGVVDRLASPTPISGSILTAPRRLTRAELVRESGASAALLAAAVAHGLMPAAETYGEDMIAVLRALAELEHDGIEPRHLRGFRQAAEREVGLIDSAIEPTRRRPGSDAQARAREAGREIAARLETVRASLVRAGLSRNDG